MTVRQSAVSGSFYPNDKYEVLRYFEHFSKDLEDINLNIKPKALIVPHAGYIYSGFTANLAYNLSKQSDFKRVIVIGPSHKIYLDNASIAMYDEYETPLNNIKIDLEYSKLLKENFDFLLFNQNAHSEHSTETQAPFIKSYFKDSTIVEIVYGKLDYRKLSELIDFCMQDEDNLVVISTDLSHFYSLKDANSLDNICLEAILNKDMKKFYDGCEACGMTGIKALTDVAIKKNLKVEFLNYCTSFDRTKDESSVVGYCSFVIGE